MKQKGLLNHLILLRVFATLTVVTGHSIIVYSNNWKYYTMTNQSLFLSNLKKFIDIYQMPLFFFISGYLFYYIKMEKAGYENQKKFIIVKFKRLLLPFCIVSFFYMMPLRILGGYKPYIRKDIFSIYIEDILLGKDAGNLWFLPVLFIIFMIVYFFSKKKIIRSFTFTLILAELSVFAPKILFIKSIMLYLVFFYFGYLVRYYSYKISSKLNIKLWGGIFPVLLILYFIIGEQGMLSRFCIFNVKIALGLLSCILLHKVSMGLMQKFPNIHYHNIIRLIDKNSFGIYLFHSPLLYPLLEFSASKDINPYLFSLVSFAILFSCSLTLTTLLANSKFLKFIVE